MKIHIFGASGSGVSTLGKLLANEYQINCFDADNFYWKTTDPPFQESFPVEERKLKISNAVKPYDEWIISGSLVSWGELVQQQFTVAIYLYVPLEERVKRLIKREAGRFGKRIAFGGDMHQGHLEFLEWAAQYDQGHIGGRSKEKHEEWMKTLACPIKRFEGIFETEKLVEMAKEFINGVCKNQKKKRNGMDII